MSYLAKHADSTAVIVGVILGIGVIVAYVIGVTDIARNMDNALNPEAVTVPAPSYDLDGAAALDLKGLDIQR